MFRAVPHDGVQSCKGMFDDHPRPWFDSFIIRAFVDTSPSVGAQVVC